MATRDAVLHATARLAGDWDAPAFARTTLSGPGGKVVLRELAARFASLDPLVRVRLLLSAAHISPRSAREACAAELAALAAAAASDREEWAVALGAALGGDFASSGGQRLDLCAAAAAAPTLQETRGSLDAAAAAAVEAAVQAAAAGREAVAPGFWPREERYLTPRLRAAARGGAYDDGEAETKGTEAEAKGNEQKEAAAAATTASKKGKAATTAAAGSANKNINSSFYGHFVPRPAAEGGEDPLASILPRSVVEMRGGAAGAGLIAAGGGAVATTAAAANAAAAAAAAAALAAAAAAAKTQAGTQQQQQHAPVSTSLFSPLHPPPLAIAAGDDEEQEKKGKTQEEEMQRQQQPDLPRAAGEGNGDAAAAAAARLFLPRASGPGLAMGGHRSSLAGPGAAGNGEGGGAGGAGAAGDGRRPAGAARSVRAKVLGLDEAIALQQPKVSLPAPTVPVAPASGAVGALVDAEEGMEEGEIEEGELEGGGEEEEAAAAGGGEKGKEQPSAKRPRQPPPPNQQQQQQRPPPPQINRGEWRDYDAPDQYGGGALDYD